jgi:Fur family peroxide stress response transcriptional regulator
MDPAEVEAALRARGCAMTRQRRALLGYVFGPADHPTAAEVLAEVRREVPSAGRATVYSTLAMLVEFGALRAERVGSETRYDANLARHHHRRCPRCGRLEDVADEHVEVRLRGEPVLATVRFEVACGGCG